jgi:type IV secretory pathway VirJ component
MSWRLSRVLFGSALLVILISGRSLGVGMVAAPELQNPPPVQSPVPPKTQPIPAAAANPQTGWTERVIHVPVVGQAYIYEPRHPTTANVVLFMSGDGGWNLGVVDMARRMMPKAIVVGISYVALRRAPGPTTKCWMPSGDLEVIAHDAEKQLNLPAYAPPVLVGYSSGATEVYEALAASPYSYSGGLAMGFCPDLPASHSVCASDNFKPPPRDLKLNEVLLPKVPELARDFYVVNGVQDQVCKPPEMHAFLDDMKNAHFYEAPGTGHGFSRPFRWGPEFDEAYDKVLESATAVIHPHRVEAVAAGTAATLEPKFEALKLPLEYDWAEGGTRALLVFVSGDGGWMAIDRGIAGFLTKQGVSVVGLNAQSYFWNERTPEQGGVDLGRLVDVADSLNVPVFVGGYSIGAETVPFMVNTWPEADRHAKIAGEVLVAPSETATFEFKVVNMLFRAKQTPYVVATAVKKSQVPTLCVSGQAEEPRDTACDDLGTAGEAVALPGSHHFNSKYDEVGKVVLAFIERQVKK